MASFKGQEFSSEQSKERLRDAATKHLEVDTEYD
jgi:hypothetical protein